MSDVSVMYCSFLTALTCFNLTTALLHHLTVLLCCCMVHCTLHSMIQNVVQ